MADATTIASLELEITSNSKEACKGLDALSNSLKKLQQATSKGLGLTAIVNEIKAASSVSSSSLDGLTGAIDKLSQLKGLKLPRLNLTGIVNSITSASTKVSATSLDGFVTAVQKLSTLKDVKLPSGLGTQLTTLVNAINSISVGGSKGKINSLVSALNGLKKLETTNLSSYVTNLKKLPEIFAALDNMDMSAFADKIKEVADALKPLGDEMQKIANGFAAFPDKLQKLIAGMNGLTGSNDGSSRSYVNLYAKIKMAKSAVVGIGKTVAKWITLASSYRETVNLFTISMGEYAESAYDYAQTVEKAMGIDPAAWMNNQAIFMTLAKGFGVAGDRADTMSQQLTQLGYDLSSFFNIKVEDAMLKLQSGLAGELEPLRRLGFDLSQAKLEAVALSLGIDKAVSSMTQAEKAELRYYAIMTQVTDAHGDMARTLDDPANQMRILKSQVTQLGRALGNFFIPVLNKVLPYLIGMARVLREVLDVFMGLLGIELATVDFGTDSITSATDDLVTNLEDAQDEAKKLKSYMLGFDELNVINADDSDSDSVLGSGLDFELPTYDFLDGLVATQFDEITKKLKEWLGLTEPINTWADFFDTKLGHILEVVGLIGAGIASWKVTKGLTDFVTKDIPAMKKMIKSTSFNIAVGVTLTLAGFAIEYAGLRDAVLNGLDKFNLAEIIGGGLLAAGGAALLGSKIATWISTAFASSRVAGAISTAASNLGLGTAGAVGTALGAGIAGIIAGIPMFIVGIYDSIVDGIDWMSAALTAVGSTAAGAGIGAIIGACGGPIGAGIGALIGLAVGAITDLVIVVVQNWDSIVEWTKSACEAIGEFFVGVWDDIVKVWDTVAAWFNKWVITPVVNFFKGLWTSVSGFFVNLWDDIKSVWKSVAEWFNTYVITPIANFFSGLWDGIKYAAKACWDGIVSFFSPAVTWFSALFNSVKQTISDVFYNIGVIAKGCWEIIKAVWEIVSQWFSTNVITPVSNFFTGLWNAISNGAKAAWEGIKTVFSAIGNWMNTYVITPIKNFFVGLWNAISDGAVGAWNGIKNAFTSAATWVNTTIIVPVGNFFSGMWNGLINGARDAWEGIKSVFSAAANFFKDTFKKAWEGVVGIFSYAGNIFVNIKDGIANVFKTIVNGLITGINNLIAIPFGAINTALTTLKNINILGLTPFTGIRTISVPKIPLLAEGGMVNSGQLFIAQERGPELVANIGGRTAVMNNDQIVESVSAGVYQAVLAALGSNNDDGGNTNIVITLDGEKIYENQQKIARGRGYNMGMGAFSFG